MTLALYGKSRRRQGGLLLAGLLAVLVAVLAGVATITSVFAHHAEYHSSGTCDGWKADAGYVGGSGRRLIIIENVKIGGQDYQSSWSTGFSTDSGTSGGIQQYTGGSIDGRTLPTSGAGQVTDTTNVWYWYGIDSTDDPSRPEFRSYDWTIFNRSGSWPAGAFSGRILQYTEGSSGTWSYSPADSETSLDAPTRPSHCDRTVRIHKVVQGSGAPAKTFSYTISPAGINGTVSSTDSDDHSVSKNVAQTVTETEALSGGWSFVKYTRKQGLDSDCGGNGWSDQGTVQGNGVSIPADSNNYTVCIYNKYTAPKTVKVQVHKYMPGPQGWQNQGQGQGDWEFTLYADNNGSKGSALPGSPNPFGHLTPSTSFSQQAVWIEETNTDGTQFFGWYLPEDPSSGNPQCNKSDNELNTATSLQIPASYFNVPGDESGVFHICAYNKPRVYDPGIQKVAADPSYSGGYAQWLIKVDNTANTQAVDVKIQDSNVVNNGAVTGGTCSDGDISDGEMLCSVNAGATLVVPVKKAVSEQCRAGEASNSATISWKAPGSSEYTSLGTVGPVVVTIPANTELCDKPGITKEANTTSTTDPSAVKWTVTVTNPASGTGTTQTVYIKDTGVNVVSGPAYTGSANCTIPGGSSFEQELTSANGVQCSMPNNSTISFVVKPAGTISRACPDKLYNNTAYLYIGSTTNTPLSAQGAEITLQGNPELCTRDLQICKVVVGNGDGYIESGTFNFDVREAGAGPNIFNGVGGLSAAEPNPDTANSDGTEVCVTKQVPTTKNIEVVEWSSRPVGWVGDASGYPQYSINGGTRTSNNTTSSIAAGSSSVKVTFYNKGLPRTREITIEKYFVGTGNYVAGAGDVPTFTLNDPDYPAVTFESACVPLANGMNNHLAWTCTVPWDWNGIVTETPAPGWEQVAVFGPDLRCEPPLSWIEALSALVQRLTTFDEGDTLKSSWTFCNRPYAEVKVQKVFVGDFASYPAFTFQSDLPGGAGDAGPAANTTVPVYDEAIDLGTYSVQEDQFLSQQEGCFGDTAAGYYTEVSVAKNGSTIVGKHEAGSASIPATAPGDQVTVTFYNTRCELAASPIVIIEKFADPAGNRSGTTSISGFQIAVYLDGVQLDGDLVAPGIQPFTSNGGPIVLAGLEPATVTAVEVNPNTGGWKFTGSKTDLGDDGSFEKSVATQPAAETITYDDVVRFNFYNQPRVNIEVNKTEISLATPAGGPGAGWSFTLTGCGITPQVAVTGANGKATFSDLPPAAGCTYTVTETVKSGWSAINPVQVTAPTAAGQTAVLNFTNVKIEVCTNCVTIVTPTPTPPTPTATATPKPSETPTSPTATPETPTQKPTEEATAGARTPGPGQTPIAPSTGNGLLGSGPAGVNMLLALVGLLAISLGTTILALGRKSSRR